MAAIAGYPHVSIPMGTVKHLPVGLSFISGKWQDETVLQVAFAYEQASAKQIKPALLLNNKVSERAAAMLPATSTD